MKRYLGEISVAALFGMSIGLACFTPPGLDASTGHFPLQGEHTALSCGACHGDTLSWLPSACIDCHLDDRPAAHSGDRLGECGACHSELGWQYAVDDHSFLPLEGGHSVTCDQCHADLVRFSDLGGSTCLTCHADDTPGPEHFPGQECNNCHNTVSWGDADFDHDDFFPLPHGEGVRNCDSCHLNNDGYQTFSCIDCHEHSNEQALEREHRGETDNFSFDSASCLGCHPQGRE